MVNCELVDKDLVLGLYYGTVARLWKAMVPWITIQREKEAQSMPNILNTLQYCPKSTLN